MAGKTNLEIMRERKMRFKPRPVPTMEVTTAEGHDCVINAKDFDENLHIRKGDRVRVTDGLGELSLKDLKGVAYDEGVATDGLRKKSDFVDAIRAARAATDGE